MNHAWKQVLDEEMDVHEGHETWLLLLQDLTLLAACGYPQRSTNLMVRWTNLRHVSLPRGSLWLMELTILRHSLMLLISIPFVSFSLLLSIRGDMYYSWMWKTPSYMTIFDKKSMGVFGCKEVGGSKVMGKYNCSFPYLSKHRKRKMRKPLFLFSFPFYTITSSLPRCATVNFVVM